MPISPRPLLRSPGEGPAAPLLQQGGLGRQGQSTVPNCWDATQQNSAKPPRAGLKDGSARLGRQWGSRSCNCDSAGTAQLGMWLSPWAGALLGVSVKIRVTGLRKRKRGVLHPEGN